MIMANRRKLAMEIVTSIRHLYKDLEYTITKLSYIFNVSTLVVYKILHNITYGDADYNPAYIPDTPLLKYYNKYIKNHHLYHTFTYEQAFKQVNGFPHYVLFIDGTIFSDYGFHYTKVKTRLMTGYIYVDLNNNNKRKTYTIHRLIAEHFIDNTNNFPCVLHKNDDKLDNTLENLYFGTQKDNMCDKFKNGRHIVRIPDVTKTAIYETINLFPNISTADLSRRFGISTGSVRKIRNEYENQRNQ